MTKQQDKPPSRKLCAMGRRVQRLSEKLEKEVETLRAAIAREYPNDTSRAAVILPFKRK